MDPNSTDPRQAPAARPQRLRVPAAAAAPGLPGQVLELVRADTLAGGADGRLGPTANDNQAPDQPPPPLPWRCAAPRGRPCRPTCWPCAAPRARLAS